MRTRTPPRTKERYILDSIPKIFKGGHWLEDDPEDAYFLDENESSQNGGGGVSALVVSGGSGTRGEAPEPACERDARAAASRVSQDRGPGTPGSRPRADGDALPAVENYGQTPYVTVIGGTKYDERELLTHIFDHPNIVVGAGRGVESDIAKSGPECGVTVIPVDPDIYGKNARKVNVEAVLSFAPESPLLLVGEGERVKQARAWLKRARWPREVIELP